ncbi:TonB-dependent receptor [Sphaerotilus sp.]|uniref:TonB-dependent receptor n=1 Tax=Sphaerotilus sp. TaxID=2093942 RepID=UPI002ACDBFFF|nr:TonB-dependent receptor plug domain-containing protein [Sphaerotilus sp.]MDZ7855817.1 TonB-dependent receptor plug domain-containing protein [Sphaerotilus sp.]
MHNKNLRTRRRASAAHPSNFRLTAIAACLLAGAAQAQQPPSANTGQPEQETQSLQAVVVTATRGSKAVEKIPGAISVITRSEIDTQGLISEDPSQLLAAQVPGYAPARQKLSNFGESLRGRNALLLLDGIPQTNPLRFGGREGYFADPMLVERIEVVSGASAVQGMGATGGIINTITRRPSRPGTRHMVELKYSTQGHADTQGWKTGYMLEHKGEGPDAFDALAYLGMRSQSVGTDGDGRKLATESLHEAADAFVKIGRDFGPQRVQLMLNRFRADGFDDWLDVAGNRSTGIPTSAQRGSLAWDSPRNNVTSASLEWTHASLAGGYASAQLFKQDFAARYSGGIISTFQDTRIAPANTLIDQSEIVADKWGLRTSWVRPDLGLAGLEFTAGIDLLHDTSSQQLTQTGRTWVPPLRYKSLAPFTQLEYEIGNLTLRGGLRDERNSLSVDSYRTLAFYGNREVAGGTREAHELVKSLGGVWRFGHSGWSSFVSYNEGFGPPDAGLILRAVRTAGQSVDKLVDLQPVVTENRELGIAWRGTAGGLSASVYESRSELGSQIIVANGIGTVQRVPIVVKGFEFSGQWRPTGTLRLDATYARTRGRTASAAGQPLELDLGARSQGPDKLVLAGQWAFAPAWSAQLNVARWSSRDANVGKFSGTTSLEEHFKGYTVADLALRWASPWGDVGAGIENLLNKQYITYYSQSHYAGTNDDYYAGRGRTLTLSWRRSF